MFQKHILKIIFYKSCFGSSIPEFLKSLFQNIYLTDYQKVTFTNDEMVIFKLGGCK